MFRLAFCWYDDDDGHNEDKDGFFMTDWYLQ